ncbi:MAG TPA: hypothetical protein VGM90_39760 [Kofleriaceae bacterium]|jgi:hypothetical protein
MADTLHRVVVKETARREAQRHRRASAAMLAMVVIGIPVGIGQAQVNSFGSTNTAGLLVALLMVFSAAVLGMRAMRRMKQRAAERILYAVRHRNDVYWTYENNEMVGYDAGGPRVRLSLVAELALPVIPAASARMRSARDLQRA